MKYPENNFVSFGNYSYKAASWDKNRIKQPCLLSLFFPETSEYSNAVMHNLYVVRADNLTRTCILSEMMSA